MTAPKRWSQELEGLRGLASLWVVLGHICVLVNFHFPILSDPSMGVDLFILLSGYLMAKNYMDRKNAEPWASTSTFKKFWLRRFFRIAPLYYVLLILAICLGSYFGEARDIIANYYPATQTNTSRYSDGSFMNIFTHVTFLFGFLPYYSFNTVLPDWSIGLEMQFYILFPFIMLGVLKFGFARTCITVVLSCLLFRILLPNYFASFPMPSMILIKLNVFVAGMLTAVAVRNRSILYIFLAVLATIISLYQHDSINKTRYAAQIGLVLMMGTILWPRSENSVISNLLKIPRAVLTNKVSVFLGDVSYSVYLLHLMIVLPVIGMLLVNTTFMEHSAALRFCMATVIILPLTYIISYFLYKFIEKPGIKLGKLIVSKIE
ncbi:TPA: acyltransferase [Klebsiella aerogenes]|nr:acyltransferase [Klebsiella aerogenes]HCR0888145.1 acyltransferase [Klebsiella aerogenes]